MVAVSVPRPPGDVRCTNFARGRDLDFLYTKCSIVVGIDFSLPLWEWFYYYGNLEK